MFYHPPIFVSTQQKLKIKNLLAFQGTRQIDVPTRAMPIRANITTAILIDAENFVGTAKAFHDAHQDNQDAVFR